MIGDVQDVVIQYEGRLRELEAQFQAPHALAGVVLAGAVSLFLALGLLVIRGQASYVWPSLPIPVVAVSARRFRRNRQSRSRMGRLQRFYKRAITRVKGDWAGTGATGERFIGDDHPYARDLHVFGEGSLFELLCIARTSIGEQGLAKYPDGGEPAGTVSDRRDL